MTSTEAYFQFLMLVNRNATNNNTNVDKGRFVTMYNDMQNRFVEWVLQKRNEDDIRDIQLLLQKDVPLSLVDEKDRYVTFSVPSNYFDFANLNAKVKAECCPEDSIHLFEVKSEDVEELWIDTNNEPSFAWRETFYHLSNNSVTLYRKNFEITEVNMTYYRYPLQIDIDGYLRLDNSLSTNVDPEFDDKVVGRILLGVAKEFAAITNDAASYQMDKDRLFTI
jgi:hypothetical protein